MARRATDVAGLRNGAAEPVAGARARRANGRAVVMTAAAALTLLTA